MVESREPRKRPVDGIEALSGEQPGVGGNDRDCAKGQGNADAHEAVFDQCTQPATLPEHRREESAQ